jgi:hypothetical protein
MKKSIYSVFGFMTKNFLKFFYSNIENIDATLFPRATSQVAACSGGFDYL